MTAFRRFLTATILCALLTALPMTAWAESIPARVDGDGATVYNQSGEAVGTLSADTALTVTAVKGKVCRVSYKGKTGYMKKSDLVKQTSAETDDSGESVNQTAYVAKDSAKVYDADGKVIGTLSLNTQVIVTAVKGKKCKVTVNGKTGYMKKSNLSSSRVEETKAESANETAYVAKDGAKVYDSDGKAIGTLSLNTQVTVTAVKGKRCKVTVNGKTGYMKKSDLSSKKVEENKAESVYKTAYVAKDGAKVYNAKGKVVATLSLDTQVTVTAISGKLCKISVGGNTGYMRSEDLSSQKSTANAEASESAAASGESSATPAKGTAQEMDWWTSGIQKIFARGTTATITDVETGLAWREQRRGGTNHADVQPLTAADTAVLKKVYGGTWSWTRRAIFVTINGKNYAASMNGMPHGGGSITGNNFNGHHCIHFTNSRTHGSNRVCELHQAAIKKALEAKL